MMKFKKNWFHVVSVSVLLGCFQAPAHTNKIKAATLIVQSQGQPPQILLTAEAEARLGIVLMPAQTRTPSSSKNRLNLPASALIYDSRGQTWLYWQVADHTYQRSGARLASGKINEISVDIDGSLIRKVVVTGAAELFSIEAGVGQ